VRARKEHSSRSGGVRRFRIQLFVGCRGRRDEPGKCEAQGPERVPFPPVPTKSKVRNPSLSACFPEATAPMRDS
jgi:hypothetical protein